MLDVKEPKVIDAINQALLKGLAVELFIKPDGRMSVKTVKRKEIKY